MKLIILKESGLCSERVDGGTKKSVSKTWQVSGYSNSSSNTKLSFDGAAWGGTGPDRTRLDQTTRKNGQN